MRKAIIAALVVSAFASNLLLSNLIQNVTAEGPVYPRGDVDYDTNVNMKDLTTLQRYLNGWGWPDEDSSPIQNVTAEETVFPRGDVDYDSNVNMKDLTTLQRYINDWGWPSDDSSSQGDTSCTEDTSSGEEAESSETEPVEPTVVGYTYSITKVDEVTETKIKTIKLWIDSKGMSGGDWANVNNNGGYADLRHPMFFAYTQVYCTGWDYFAKELNEEIGQNFSASELKKAYQNGEMELWIDLPNVNTSETNAKDWYVNRMISTYDWWCNEWKQTRTINDELKTYLLTPKSGKTWEQWAFEQWRLAHGDGYVTGNVQIGVWKRPVTKVITPASKSISRTGIIYSDNTVKSITPVKTNYAIESTFLAQQGISFPSSDPAWIEYLS